jgi:hypothetical protein
MLGGVWTCASTWCPWFPVLGSDHGASTLDQWHGQDLPQHHQHVVCLGWGTVLDSPLEVQNHLSALPAIGMLVVPREVLHRNPSTKHGQHLVPEHVAIPLLSALTGPGVLKECFRRLLERWSAVLRQGVLLLLALEVPWISARLLGPCPDAIPLIPCLLGAS